MDTIKSGAGRAQANIRRTAARKRLHAKNLKSNLIAVLALVVMCAANAEGVYPFGASFYFALCMTGGNVFLFSAVYAASAILFQPTVTGIATVCGAVAMQLIASAIMSHTSARPKLWLGMLLTAVGFAGTFYACFAGQISFVKTAAQVMFGVLFYLNCHGLTRTLSVTVNRVGLTRQELASLGVFGMAAVMGLESVPMVGALLTRIAYGCTVVLMLRKTGGGYAVGFAAMAGFGAALCEGLGALAAFAGIAAVSSLFADCNKFLIATSCMLTEVIFGVYFIGYGTYSAAMFASMAIGFLAGALLPIPPLIGRLINGDGQRTTAASLMERDRLYLRGKLDRAEEACRLLMLGFGGKQADGAQQTIARKAAAKLCAGCHRQSICYRGYSVPVGVEETVHAAFQKRRATLSTLSYTMTQQCPKAEELIALIERPLSEYLRSEEEISMRTRAREAVFQAFGELMRRLSKEIGSGVLYDEELRRKLMIECVTAYPLSVAVHGQHRETIRIEMKGDDPELARKLSEAEGRRYVQSAEEETVAGTEYVFLRAAQCEIVFGVSRRTKFGSAASGDTYAVRKIDANTVLIAVCDGMGSGRAAEELSLSTIAAIEACYGAGCRTEDILSLVNSLIESEGGEVFSAVDLCVIDLMTLEADFIKMGASYGLHLAADGSVIDGGALPLGAISAAKPRIEHRTLSVGDMLEFHTDGVGDLFGSGAQLAEFCRINMSVNPQSLCDTLVSYCVRADKDQPHDDMTALIARVVPVCTR